jgi:hypothetical protein
VLLARPWAVMMTRMKMRMMRRQVGDMPCWGPLHKLCGCNICLLNPRRIVP